jgi:hypothetical protein
MAMKRFMLSITEDMEKALNANGRSICWVQSQKPLESFWVNT